MHGGSGKRSVLVSAGRPVVDRDRSLILSRQSLLVDG
jgi:hypothetical protein